MSKNKLILIILLTVLTTAVGFSVIGKKTLPLVSPVLKQEISKQSTLVPSTTPSTSSYNPPTEIKYGSSTDLKQELETVNPQVLDSDFQSL